MTRSAASAFTGSAVRVGNPGLRVSLELKRSASKFLRHRPSAVGAGFVWAFGTGLILFLAIKYTIGLRVTEEEEMAGLDISEHGNEAYNMVDSMIS